jgi:hypothetical protein
MTRTRSPAAVLAAAMILAGCSSGAADDTPTLDEQFVTKLVDAKVLPDGDPPPGEPEGLIAEANAWCENLADPDVTDEMIDQAVEDLVARNTREDALKATIVLGTAVEVYCPEVGEERRGQP